MIYIYISYTQRERERERERERTLMSSVQRCVLCEPLPLARSCAPRRRLFPQRQQSTSCHPWTSWISGGVPGDPMTAMTDVKNDGFAPGIVGSILEVCFGVFLEVCFTLILFWKYTLEYFLSPWIKTLSTKILGSINMPRTRSQLGKSTTIFSCSICLFHIPFSVGNSRGCISS